jgi:hypothetical protein
MFTKLTSTTLKLTKRGICTETFVLKSVLPILNRANNHIEFERQCGNKPKNIALLTDLNEIYQKFGENKVLFKDHNIYNVLLAIT